MTTAVVVDRAVVAVGRWCLQRGIRSVARLQPTTWRRLEGRAGVGELTDAQWTRVDQWLQARPPIRRAPACLRCVIAGAGQCEICRRPMQCSVCREPMDPYLTSLGESRHVCC